MFNYLAFGIRSCDYVTDRSVYKHVLTISQLGSVLLGQSWAELFDLLEDKQGT